MRAPGGPEVLELKSIDVGAPGPGQARLRQTAVGVNVHDIYVRSGLYKTLPLPGSVVWKAWTSSTIPSARTHSSAR